MCSVYVTYMCLCVLGFLDYICVLCMCLAYVLLCDDCGLFSCGCKYMGIFAHCFCISVCVCMRL